MGKEKEKPIGDHYSVVCSSLWQVVLAFSFVSVMVWLGVVKVWLDWSTVVKLVLFCGIAFLWFYLIFCLAKQNAAYLQKHQHLLTMSSEVFIKWHYYVSYDTMTFWSEYLKQLSELYVKDDCTAPFILSILKLKLSVLRVYSPLREFDFMTLLRVGKEMVICKLSILPVLRITTSFQ